MRTFGVIITFTQLLASTKMTLGVSKVSKNGIVDTYPKRRKELTNEFFSL